MPVTRHLVQPTREQCGPHLCSPIWSCSGWGLPCHTCYQARGALLPHHFTLTLRTGRYIFCGTFRRLTPPRRYLASCPAEPGLSSPAGYVYPSGATAWPTPVANITDMGAVLRDIAALSKYDRTLLVKQGVNGNLIRCAPQQATHGAIDKMMPRQKRQDTAPA